MTRDQQAAKEAEYRYREHPNSLYNELAFRAGADWADRTMIDKAVRWLYRNEPERGTETFRPQSYDVRHEVTPNNDVEVLIERNQSPEVTWANSPKELIINPE